MARRQIYGGREADETRNKAAVFADQILDNEIAEGVEVAELRKRLIAMYDSPTSTAKKAVEDYIAQLKKAGHADSRIESMYTRASARLSVPNTKQTVTALPSARCLRRRARKGLA